MQRLTVAGAIAVLGSSLVCSLTWRIAAAQSADPGPDAQSGARPGASAPGAMPGATPAAIDEAKIRELVDREVARILTERAAREAQERVVRDAADKDAGAAEDTSELRGASGFLDTRLAFTLTNENLLAAPGETTPSAPGWRFGTPNSLGVLFFDGYDTRYSGFETLSHATLYRDYSAGHVQAEGALVVRIDDLSTGNIALSDDGSYLTVSDWRDPSHKDPTRISLTAFPVSSDRFRLGYSYRLSWGGDPEYRRSGSPAPGLKLQYDGPGVYAFVGAKSALITDSQDGEAKAALGVLGGAGVDPFSMLRLEANGGYFDRGYNDLSAVQNTKVRLFGASVQASLHRGMPVTSSLDYRLYKFHGESISGLFAPERYPGGLSWLIQSEFTVLGETLKDPAVAGATKTQVGKAGDVNVRVKLDRWRLRLDLSYRDVAFVLHDQPSIPDLPSLSAFQALPAANATTADYFGAIGADRNWGDWLTLGLIGGVEKPATVKFPDGVPGMSATGPVTAVVRSNNVDTLVTLLPTGASVTEQVAVKGTAKLDFARVYSVLVELFYSHDGNQVRDRTACTSLEVCSPEAGTYNQLGLNATLQARF